MKVLGNADEFYRLRLVRLDDSDEPDLEWRDDILYRRPPMQRLEEYESYRVEAVSVGDEDDVTVLSSFATSDEAAQWLSRAEEDLRRMTKSRFEEAYFPQS